MIRKGLLKTYHQQGANLKDAGQNIEFTFGENNNYHQLRNTYFENYLTVRKKKCYNSTVAGDNTNEVISLVNFDFSNCCKEARLGKTGCSDLDHYNYVGQICTNMRAFTSKDG